MSLTRDHIKDGVTNVTITFFPNNPLMIGQELSNFPGIAVKTFDLINTRMNCIYKQRIHDQYDIKPGNAWISMSAQITRRDGSYFCDYKRVRDIVEECFLVNGSMPLVCMNGIYEVKCAW